MGSVPKKIAARKILVKYLQILVGDLHSVGLKGLRKCLKNICIYSDRPSRNIFFFLPSVKKRARQSLA